MFDEEKQKLLILRSRRIIEGIDKEFSKRKKIRVILYICLLMWGAAGAQMAAERISMRPSELAAAFADTNTGMNQSMIELTAYYGSRYLSASDKSDLVRYLAEGLGISVDQNAVSGWKDAEKEAVLFTKEAKRASTAVKCVTLDGTYSKTGQKEHYLFVRIIIHEDSQNAVKEYQAIIQELYRELGAEVTSETLQYTGRFAGKLTISELNSLADRMIQNLDGKIVYENRKEELFTVYAYSRGLRDYVTLDGVKMNIQVAASYDEENDQTVLYLAAPAVSGGF